VSGPGSGARCSDRQKNEILILGKGTALGQSFFSALLHTML
jgi:hypothetical protein